MSTSEAFNKQDRHNLGFYFSGRPVFYILIMSFYFHAEFWDLKMVVAAPKVTMMDDTR